MSCVTSDPEGQVEVEEVEEVEEEEAVATKRSELLWRKEVEVVAAFKLNRCGRMMMIQTCFDTVLSGGVLLEQVELIRRYQNKHDVGS